MLIKKIQIIITPHFPTYNTVNTRHNFPSFPPQYLLWADKLQNDGPRFRLVVEWRLFMWKSWKPVEQPNPHYRIVYGTKTSLLSQ